VYIRRNEKTLKNEEIEEEEDTEEEKDEYEHDENHGQVGDWNDESYKVLCNGDIALLLLPNPEGIRDLLAMEVNDGHTKGME